LAIKVKRGRLSGRRLALGGKFSNGLKIDRLHEIGKAKKKKARGVGSLMASNPHSKFRA